MPRTPSPQEPDDAASAATGTDPVGSVEAVAEKFDQRHRIGEIAALDMAALRASWAALFGRPPPNSLSRRLLEYAASYHVQAKSHGTLKPATRRRLLQIAGSRSGSTNPGRRRKLTGALSPGSRLVREWHGGCHTVEATERGFLYAGRTYQSLSEVARAITGARWSGPRFFGL